MHSTFKILRHYFPFCFWIQAATCNPHEMGTKNVPPTRSGLIVDSVIWLRMLDSWAQYVPTTKAISDNGQKTDDGIFSPTPRTEDGGADPSQYVGPTDIFRVGRAKPMRKVIS